MTDTVSAGPRRNPTSETAGRQRKTINDDINTMRPVGSGKRRCFLSHGQSSGILSSSVTETLIARGREGRRVLLPLIRRIVMG